MNRRERLIARANATILKSERDFRRSLHATKATNGVGTIYFIEAPILDVMKIGWTSLSPYARLRNLQTANHTDLRLVAAVAGSQEDERRLHEEYRDSLCRGGRRSEWFRMSRTLFEMIRLMRGGDCRDDFDAAVKQRFAWLIERPTYEDLQLEACRRALAKL